MVNGRFAGLSVDPYGLRSYLPSRIVVWSTIAAYVRISRRQRKREGERERERKARRGGQRSRVALSVYRAVFAVTFDPARCLSLSLSPSRSPPLLCPRSRSLPSFILARFGTMRLRCANDRAADIGNYSLRNLRAPSSSSPPSSFPAALSPSRRAFVSYRPSLSFPPPSSFPRRIIFHPRIAATNTAKSAS